MRIDKIFIGLFALGTLASSAFVLTHPNPNRNQNQSFTVEAPVPQKPSDNLRITKTGEWKAAFQPLPSGSSHETQRIFREVGDEIISILRRLTGK